MTKKTKKVNKILVVLFSIFLILTAIPVIIFILNFNSQNLSSDISDWSSFGSYLSGTVSIIISFFSLIILAYLTHLVSTQTNEENKKINLLLRRLDSYDKLTSYMPKMNLFFPEMRRLTSIILKKLTVEQNLNSIKDDIKELNSKVTFIAEFYYFLFSFNAMYGHLFNYDFNSEDFKTLVENAKKVNEYYQNVTEKFVLQETGMPTFDSNAFNEMFDYLPKFLNSLREELK